MNRKLISLTIVLGLLMLGISHLSADTNKVDGVLVSIETNDSISSARIDIVNCSNHTQVFNHTFTDENGTFSMDYNQSWGPYLINATHSNYISRQYSNNSQCFTNGSTNVLDMYRYGTGTINLTIVDEINSRPIPGADVDIKELNVLNSSYPSQSYNYRCINDTCKTDEQGNLILIVPVPGTYVISLGHTDYEEENITLPKLKTSDNLGKDWSYTAEIMPGQVIDGYVTDKYNGMAIEGAHVNIYKHGEAKNLSFGGIYNYSATTDEDGYYKIRLPSSLIPESTHYDMSAYHPDWQEGINNNGNSEAEGGFESIQRNIDLELTGLLKINGSIVDCYNSVDTDVFLDISIIDKTANRFDYHASVSDGTYSIFVRNNSGGYSGYNMTIGSTYYDSLEYADAVMTLDTCINGSMNVSGTVKDLYNDEKIEGANIDVDIGTSGSYHTTSDSDGYFEIPVKAGYTPYINIINPGYLPIWDIEDDDGDFEDIYMTGNNQITGITYDKETFRRTDGPPIQGVNVSILNRTSLETLYEASANKYGYYAINIDGNIDEYTIRFEKELYQTLESDHTNISDPSYDIYLTGDTHIEGHILDSSAYFTQGNITAGSTLRFKDNTGIRYELNPLGDTFSIDMAIEDFNMTATRPGYDNATKTGYISASWTESNILLDGSLDLDINTTDNFSRESTSDINIRLLEKQTGKGIYEGMQTSQGNIKISVDSTRDYGIVAYHDNYLPRRENITANGTTFEEEYILIAKYETQVIDEENGKPIPNATVQAYHLYNKSHYDIELNSTTINVTVNCSGQFLDDIDITIDSDNYNDSKDTLSGIATFKDVPTGNYTIYVNGSLAGCGLNTSWIDVTEGGTIYDKYMKAEKTTLVLSVLNPINELIYPANASYETSPGVWDMLNSTAGNRYYYDFMPSGKQVISANESRYYQKTVECNITSPGNSNPCNITLHPHPGNISIMTIDETSTSLSQVIVNITNGTETDQKNTDVTGFADFTGMESIIDITLNATSFGYMLSNQTEYIYPETTTTVIYKLNRTHAILSISDDLGPIEDANVSLTDSQTGNTLKSADGSALTGLTDSSGDIEFYRFNVSDCNITIDEPSHIYYNQSYSLSLDSDNLIPIDLDVTRVSINVIDTFNKDIGNIPVTLNKTDGSYNYSGTSNSTGIIVFDNQTFAPGLYNLTVDGTGHGYNLSTQMIDVKRGIKEKKNVTIEENLLTVQVNSSFDNSSAPFVDVYLEGTSKTNQTGLDGICKIHNLENKSYNVTINGTSVGFNWTNASIDVDGLTYLQVFLEENTLVVSVKDENGEGVDGGVEVTLWDPYDTDIYEDALGQNLIEQTESYDSNATFRRLAYEVSGNDIKIEVNGSASGYGYNLSDYTLNNGQNGPYEVSLNITKITVNVTDASYSPVAGADVSVLTLEGAPVHNATGKTLTGLSDASGMITFERMIPGHYNITLSKDVDGDMVHNSSLANISSGNHSYVHIDPNNTLIPSLMDTYYRSILDDEYYNLTINLTDGSNPIVDADIYIYASGLNFSEEALYNYEESDNKTTDSNGIFRQDMLPAGSYDLRIDPEDEGFGIIEERLLIGKLVMSEGQTDSDGVITLPVDGREIDDAVGEGYFINVVSAGYGTNDTYEEGEAALHGTYYDHVIYNQTIYPGLTNNQRYLFNMKGIINISGTVVDKFADDAQHSFRYLKDSLIEVIPEGSFQPRYTTYTDENGTYQLDVSAAMRGAGDLDTPANYNIRVSKRGYQNETIERTMPVDETNLTEDMDLTGTAIVNGSTIKYDGGIVGNVEVIYKDNSTNTKIYSTRTDTSGYYELNVNPYYEPYRLSFLDDNSNTKNYTTQAYVRPNHDETIYLISQAQAMIDILIADEYGNPIEGINTTLLCTERDSKTYLQSDINGKIDLFIDNDEWVLGNYTITTDGKELGYGLRTDEVVIDSGYNTMTLRLNMTRLNISVIGNHGENVTSTTAILYGDSNNSKNIDNNTFIFEGLKYGNYTIGFTSDYFVGDNISIEINESNVGTTIDIAKVLNETRLEIDIWNGTDRIFSNISFSAYGPENESYSTDADGRKNISKLLYGPYDIVFNNMSHFHNLGYELPDNHSTNITKGTTNHLEIIPQKRIIDMNVSLYELSEIYMEDAHTINETNITVILVNESGNTFNWSGTSNELTVDDGHADFYGLRDDTYSINISSDIYHYDNSTIFETESDSFEGYKEIYLKKVSSGYINVTLTSNKDYVPIEDATLNLYWNGSVIGTSKTDSMGRSMLSANASIYNESLTIEAISSGYISKNSTRFNITEGVIDDKNITLSEEVTSSGSGPSKGDDGRDHNDGPIYSPSSTSTDDEKEENETENDNFHKDLDDTNIGPMIYKLEYYYDDMDNDASMAMSDGSKTLDMLESYIWILSETEKEEIYHDTKDILDNINIIREINVNDGYTEVILDIGYEDEKGNDIKQLIVFERIPDNYSDMDIEFDSDHYIKRDGSVYMIVLEEIDAGENRYVSYTIGTEIKEDDRGLFSRPLFLSTGSLFKNMETETQQENILEEAFMSYWWLFAIAALGLVLGIYLRIRNSRDKPYSFRPQETKRPLNPPLRPATAPMYGSYNAQKTGTGIGNIKGMLADGVRNLEKEIAKDVTKVAEKEVVYLTKPLEKEKFIVD